MLTILYLLFMKYALSLNTADRQAAIMYMLARYVLGARFFLMPDDVKLMPRLYQA